MRQRVPAASSQQPASNNAKEEEEAKFLVLPRHNVMLGLALLVTTT